MRILTNTVLCTLLALTWLASTAGVSLAELGSGAESEQNRFSWHPSITTSIAGEDNSQLERSDTNSDLGFFVTPRIELAYQGHWFDLGADLGADILQYTDSSSPSDQFYRMIGWGELGIIPGVTMRLSNAFVPTAVDLASPEDSGANLVQTNRTVADVRLWYALPGESELAMSFQGSRMFSEGFAAQVGGSFDPNYYADFWEGAMVGEFQMPIIESLSGFARTHVRYRSFDDGALSDFGDLALLVGIRTSWFRNVDFDMAVGYGMLGFASGDTKHRFVGDLNLQYRAATGTTLTLSLANRNTVDILGNDFIESTGRISVEQRFGERMAAEVAVFASRLDNETWNSGANFYGGVDANLRRQMSRNTQLELGYRYWNNGGSYSSDDFSQNRLMLTFTYRR